MTMMRSTLGLLVLLALMGCQYPAAQGPYDFSAAASLQWVVTVSNGNVCRQRPWYTGTNGYGFDACGTGQALLTCGTNSPPLFDPPRG